MSSDARQIIGGIFTIVGYATIEFGWGYALIAIGAALSYSGARQAAKEAKAEAERRAKGANTSQSIKGNYRGGAEAMPLVFGEVRVGGLIVALGTRTGNSRVLYVCVAHSLAHAGGCDGITDIWLDDKKIAAADLSGDPNTAEVYVDLARYIRGADYMVQVRHYRGTSSQIADVDLSGSLIGSAATDYRRGVAWSKFTLTRPTAEYEEAFRDAFPRGVPTVAATLRGIRCYDPRLDSTNGGSGSQLYADPTTWTWTQNPALIAATYMFMAQTDGGMGRDPALIDWSTVASAANICDESVAVPSGTQDRYSCNIYLSSTEAPEVNLRRILDTMQGECIPVSGIYKIYAGAYRSPTFTLDESWLRGSVTVRTRSPLEELYNSVRILHDDAAQNFRQVEAPAFSDATYITDDGGVELWREEMLEGVTDTYQAQRIGAIIGKRSRAQRIIEVPCNLRALDVECWENGSITLAALGLSSSVHRVTDWTWDGEGPVLILRQESSSYYSGAAYDDAITDPPTDLTSETPDAPTGVAATLGIDGIDITWTAPQASAVQQIDVYRSTSIGGTYTLLTGAVGYRYHDAITVAGTYYYKLKARTNYGGESAFSSVVSATVPSPDDVVNLKLANLAGTTFSGRDAAFEWDNGQPPANVRFRSYRVRIIDPADSSVMRETYTTAPRFTYTYEMNLQDSTAVAEGYSAPLRTFTIEVVQTSIEGVISATPASLTVTNAAPVISPDVVTLTPFVGGFTVAITQPTDPDLTLINVYASTVNGFTPSGANLVYRGPFQSKIPVYLTDGTLYYVRVSAEDVFGAGGYTTQTSATTGSAAVDTTPPTAPGTPTFASSIEQYLLTYSGKITASWSAASDASGAWFYEVEYWTSSASDTTRTQTSQDQTSYTIFPATVGVTYSVRVRAVDYAGNASAWSATATHSITPTAVGPNLPTTGQSPFSASWPQSGDVSAGLDKIVLSWTNPTNGDFLETEVHRSTSSGFTPTSSTRVGKTRGQTFVDAKPTIGTAYYYKLIAVNVQGVQGSATSQGTATAVKITSSNYTTYIAAGSIDADRLIANSITAAQIDVNTITADRMNVSQLSAIAADLGTITAGTVTGATIRTAASGSRVQLDGTNGIQAYNLTNQRVSIKTDGSGWLGSSSNFSWDPAGNVTVGTLTGTGTITGPTLQTASSGKRIVISAGAGASDDEIAGYDASGNEIFRLGLSPVDDGGVSCIVRAKSFSTSYGAAYFESAATSSNAGALRLKSPQNVNPYTLQVADGGVGIRVQPWASTSYVAHLALIGNSALTVFPSATSLSGGITVNSSGQIYFNTSGSAWHNLLPTWVKFNGTGTPAISDSNNVASITDHGAGEFTVVFDVDFLNANYSILTGGVRNAGGNTLAVMGSATVPATTGWRMAVRETSLGTLTDPDHIACGFFGSE